MLNIIAKYLITSPTTHADKPFTNVYIGIERKTLDKNFIRKKSTSKKVLLITVNRQLACHHPLVRTVCIYLPYNCFPIRTK
ncbi:hypothetical protein CWN88_13365 [Vibrio splendidus]|uniref:Uncharacterized protein n=1 Tax=Vibrio splendidus TaxID=29497 RepID=A0A2R6VT72_VIBSP|nr:hypothetical protein [Vibrio splendidus]PTO59433.1 hypothetical protein CWN82_06785 [Vibrio splendidus]PTO93028.1 hypothetical protein CWO29_04380 [Vibrio splendidus]PTP01238.1 hypothetical protein CWN88_13365 [Vibrio splendidus]PTP41830.1 hypothetical protein CWN87_15350 [Vibrio splendidus]